MKKIGIIINPNAKRVRKLRKNPQDEFSQIGGEYADVRSTRNFEELHAVIAEFKKNKYPYIGILGGDGTIHHVLTSLINIYDPEPVPPLLILKGGTMNNVARTICLRGNGASILKRMVAVMKEGREPAVHRRDTIKIGDRHCFLFGIGFTTNFLELAYSGKEKGVIQNIKVIKKAVRDAILQPPQNSMYQRIEAKIITDGRELDFSHITGILTGTVEHVGMGFSPMPDANLKDGTFQAIISGLGPHEIICNLPGLKKGRQIQKTNHFNGLVHTLEIQTKDNFKYTMDGDLYESGPRLTVETGQPVKLVYV